MRACIAVVFLLVVLSASVEAFISSFKQARKHATIPQNKQVLLAKPDLFSDDLFGDDEDGDDSNTPAKKEKGEGLGDAPKKTYLDEDWNLSPEDAAEFKGFPGMKSVGAEPVEPADKVPCFALMYKFRKEYLEGTSVDAMLSDHRGHCTKFKRLLNSEVINMGKAKGVVLLFAGFTETDKEETRAEIMSFLEEDPLVMRDVVENWDIIDISQPGKAKEETAAPEPANAE